MIWVILLHFAHSGATEPMFAYPTEEKCKQEIMRVQAASEKLEITAECVAFKPNSE